MPATFLTWVSGIFAALNIPECLGHTDPTPIAVGTLLIILAAAAGLSIPRSSWRWFGLFTTLVHELGHAFAGLATGRIITSITIRGDQSGAAGTAGYGTLSAVVTGFFGYPAPALAGAGLLWCVFNGYTAAALVAGTVITCATVLFIRNFVGLLVVAATAAASAALWLYAPPDLQSYALLTLGVALLVGAVRGLVTVIRVHTSHRDQLDTSDASILFRQTMVPAPLWLAGFTAVIGWAWWAAAVTYIGTLG